jgi:NhaP-type Na+/H+ or K+/H+ antiporter
VLAVGLVLATVVLGAILGATDPISATAIIRRLGAPQRIATVLEGEALINDGTALTAFKVALAAAASRSFSPGHGAFEFIVVSAGGIAVGVAVGAASAFVRRRLDDPNLETAIGVLTAYAAYIASVLFALRLAWMFGLPTAPRLRAGLLGGRGRRFDSREQVVLGWSGMRGALSIAAALSVPFATFAGDRSQTRSLVVFLAFAATFVTLVLPGLTLASLIRRLGLGDSERRLRMALEARLRVARAALSRLDAIAESGDVSARTLAQMRELYETRAGAYEARLGEQESRGRVDALEEQRRVQRATAGCAAHNPGSAAR